MIRPATASVSCGAISFMFGELVGHRRRQLLADGPLGYPGADPVGQRQLAAEVVRLLGADPEVGAYRRDPVLLAEPGAGQPAVARTGFADRQR